MVKHDEIIDALASRKDWEARQALWAQMREEGVRRKNKPWPNAADMHFPLGDIQVEKLKPYYVQQMFAQETVATFRALKAEVAGAAAANAQWFDYQMKENSNLEEEFTIAIDSMLEGAKSVVKVYWDPETKQVQFDSIERLHLIVPAWTKKLEKADWIVHVQQYSVAAYKLKKELKQDDEFVKAITGGGDDQATNATESDRYAREGITRPAKDQIVIWEVFARDPNNARRWIISTYSPTRPDDPVREPFALPYAEGLFAKGAPPFAELTAEVKGKGFYSARSVIQRVAPFEASLCADWNTQKDYQRLTCSPVFTAKGPGIPDGTNIRMIPGQIMPFPIEAVVFPQMPVDLQQQMIGTRMIAEQVIQTPDFGAAQQTNTSKARTATEMNMAGQQAGQGIDLRSRVFRREFGYALKLAWALCIQYMRDEVNYLYQEELLQVDPAQLVDAYRIEPSGSGDNMNRQFVMQKAVARLQMFKGDQDIDQKALKRGVLEADDPRLCKSLLLDAGTQNAMQLEDQAQEISILLINFPAQVKPTDDDSVHLQALTGFLQRKMQKQEWIEPEQVIFLGQHAQAHLAQWKKKNPPQFGQQGAPFMQFWQGVMAEAQQHMAAMAAQAQAAQAPNNVVAMGGAM